jgi:hypothetical protein
MGNIIDEKSGRMNVGTYESIQTVKYRLRSSKKSAIHYFQRKDKLHSPIKTRICRGIRLAYSRYNEELQEAKKKREAELERLTLRKKAVTKQKAKRLVQRAEQQAFLKHTEKQERLRKLTVLAAKRAKAAKNRS